jgi:hypothetical protein
MGTALPAANFLREINNMLYRERQDARRHDQAMGNIGLRTATFKYNMEQDRQNRQERQEVRQYQRQQAEENMKLRQAEAARAEEAHERNLQLTQAEAERQKQLLTPTDFRAYDVVPKEHVAWQDPEFVADMEAKTGGKFNPTSGMFMAKGKNKQFRPLDIKKFLPIMVGNADMKKGDSIQDNLISLHKRAKLIKSIDADIKKASGASGADPRRAIEITKLKQQRARVVERAKINESRLTPTGMLETYG